MTHTNEPPRFPERFTTMTLAAAMCANLTLARVLDPDCTAKKAAKATVGIENKEPMEKRGHEKAGVVKKVVK